MIDGDAQRLTTSFRMRWCDPLLPFSLWECWWNHSRKKGQTALIQVKSSSSISLCAETNWPFLYLSVTVKTAGLRDSLSLLNVAVISFIWSFFLIPSIFGSMHNVKSGCSKNVCKHLSWIGLLRVFLKFYFWYDAVMYLVYLEEVLQNFVWVWQCRYALLTGEYSFHA